MRTATGLAVIGLAGLAGFASGCSARQGNHEPSSGTLITSEDLQNPNLSIEQVLQRKVPGLRVSRATDGSLVLQLRDSDSYRGGTPPLYVLNGLPYRPGPGGALTGINPLDIASIQVLRGAEAALYGIDGVNGVIVITTKMGGSR